MHESENFRLKTRTLKKLALAFALCISFFLAIAAYGKFFFPVENLRQIDQWTSYVELLLIVLLLCFRMHCGMWLSVALLFASWGGYALYWFCLRLPCSCAGKMISFPSSYALMLDVFFFLLSCTLAWLLRATRNALYLTLVGSLLCLFIGYIFADWIFTYKILGMNWSLRKY